ncbi:MAG: hypothetical protein ACIAQF_09950 [Phycisphaerales bacterium JB065]
MPAAIQLEESETPSGWRFIGEVESGEIRRRIEMVVSWADYEYWGRGLVRPIDVARSLLRVAIRTETLNELPEKFDAARLRRTVERFDELVRAELGFEELSG